MLGIEDKKVLVLITLVITFGFLRVKWLFEGRYITECAQEQNNHIPFVFDRRNLQQQQ